MDRSIGHLIGIFMCWMKSIQLTVFHAIFLFDLPQRGSNCARYMDDSYLIHHSKEYLQHCLEEIKKLCNELGIVLNPKKTQIVKLSRGLTFLKTRFNLTNDGKVIKRVNKEGIVKMRRKLKIFKRWLAIGKMTPKDVETSYRSWQGHVNRCNSYHVLENMEKLYVELFPKTG
jgi:hypothetical protein